VLLALPSRLLAQIEDSLDWPVPKNAVALNLGGIAVNTVSLGYIRAINNQVALGIHAGYLFHPVGNQRAIGYEGWLQLRYHPAHKALWRFYWSFTGGYQRISVKKPDAEAGGPMAGFITGWQWFPQGQLAVGLGVGVQQKFGGKGTPNDAILKAFGTQPILSFDIGYAW
jgi:hypothetical protein